MMGDSILKPLVTIFLKFLEESKVPKEWKNAKVVKERRPTTWY
jgi:hypothetical protein